MKVAIVCGAGGFIGSHLVRRLRDEDYLVLGIDLKYPEFSDHCANSFLIRDLSDPMLVDSVFRRAKQAYGQIDEVYQLAADMGGAEYIFSGENDSNVMTNSALINLNVVRACVKFKVGKVFYSSSACIYPAEEQLSTFNEGLEEHVAYPANPDSEYGWEKLFSERLYMAYGRNHGLNVRIGRFHNIYGPEGTWRGGREKAPAAMCRKIALATENDPTIEVFGDGQQTRSFLFIDECIEGVRRLMISDVTTPVNIGSDKAVSINELAYCISLIADKKILLRHTPTNVEGVRGRNSDNTLIGKLLNWKPNNNLEYGLSHTYEWIKEQVKKLPNIA